MNGKKVFDLMIEELNGYIPAPSLDTLKFANSIDQILSLINTNQ